MPRYDVYNKLSIKRFWKHIGVVNKYEVIDHSSCDLTIAHIRLDNFTLMRYAVQMVLWLLL